MKKIILITIGLLYLFLCSACKKEHVAPINQLVKDLFCFKTGSEWVYYDSVSQTTQKMVITNYEATRLESTPKGGRRAYNFAELVDIKGYFLTDFEVRVRSQGDEEKDNNTAIFGGTYKSSNNTNSSLPLRFKCDENNNFNSSVSYFAEYNMNNIDYKNVYAFNMDENTENIIFYAAKNIGIIRMVKIDDFDWVLTDKNVLQ